MFADVVVVISGFGASMKGVAESSRTACGRFQQFISFLHTGDQLDQRLFGSTSIWFVVRDAVRFLCWNTCDICLRGVGRRHWV